MVVRGKAPCIAEAAPLPRIRFESVDRRQGQGVWGFGSGEANLRKSG